MNAGMLQDDCICVTHWPGGVVLIRKLFLTQIAQQKKLDSTILKKTSNWLTLWYILRHLTDNFQCLLALQGLR